MASYCTFAEIKYSNPDWALFSTTDENYEAALVIHAEQASRAIDNELGVWDNYFYPSTADETRYFDGLNEIFLPIDDMVSLTSVAVAEEGGTSSSDYTTWTEDTDFYVWPYNYSAQSRPIRALQIDWNGDKLSWTRYPKAVKVAGVFGYSASPPQDIRRACAMQAVRWYMRAKQGYQDTGAGLEPGSLEFVPVLDPDIVKILFPYKLRRIVTPP